MVCLTVGLAYKLALMNTLFNDMKPTSQLNWGRFFYLSNNKREDDFIPRYECFDF
jgi:hypothetical protein